MKANNYKSLDNLFITVGSKYDVSPTVVKKVYESVFSLMKQVIRELPELKETSVEDMEKLRSNFFIPKFGRFFIDLERIKKKRELDVIRQNSIKINRNRE
jgi:hypothetical protein